MYFDKDFEGQATNTACVLTSSGGKKYDANKDKWVLLSPMYKTEKANVVNSCRRWETAYINDERTSDLLSLVEDASVEDLNTLEFDQNMNEIDHQTAKRMINDDEYHELAKKPRPSSQASSSDTTQTVETAST